MVKKHCASIILSSFLIVSTWAATPIPSLMATTPQPSWSELTVPEKIILAPLSDDWDSLEAYRQKMWLGIATRFPSMAPWEQRRVQGQMQAWGKLTLEQRELARKNFLSANQLPAEKKAALREKWMEYSKLSKAEKDALMQQVTEKPALRRLPPPVSKLPTPAGLDKRHLERPARSFFFRPRAGLAQPDTLSLPAE
jgi:hypothetical protein